MNALRVVINFCYTRQIPWMEPKPSGQHLQIMSEMNIHGRSIFAIDGLKFSATRQLILFKLTEP
jgi:hypothetical protein